MCISPHESALICVVGESAEDNGRDANLGILAYEGFFAIFLGKGHVSIEIKMAAQQQMPTGL